MIRREARRHVLLLVGLLFVLTAGSAPPGRADPAATADRTWLQDFAQQERARSRRARERARRVAEQKGWALRSVGPDGTLYVLVRLDDRGAPVYYETHNLGAAETVSTDHVWASTEPGSGDKLGFDLSGGGETVGVWDAGAIFEHSEFGGRVAWRDDTNPDTSDHATHVSGTMIAEGLDADAHGMAHELELLGWDFFNDDAEISDAAADGLRASNHSYGTLTGWAFGSFCSAVESDTWTWFGDPTVSDTEDYRFGFYGSGARQWDAIVYNAPRYLIVQSAGNDRSDRPPNDGADGHVLWDSSGDCTPSTQTRRPDGEKESVGGHTNAKNVLAVGAVEEIPGGYGQASDVVISSFSSFGPTDDGRIKPELVAKGVGTYSTVTGDAYATFDGTSMAAPNVTGSVALLLELYRSLHGNPPPLASTMRAVLIHTADTAGGHPSPDYTYGWGLLNTSRAADLFRRDARADSPLIHEVEVTEGDSVGIDFAVDTPDSPVKVTLAWTDPPGTPPSPSLDPSDTMLINNLDLRVIGPDGTTFLPWVPSGDGSNDTVLPVGDNDLGVNEQVLLSAPVDTGTYTARISLTNELPGTQTQTASLVIGDSSVLRLPPGGSGGGGGTGGGSCLIERSGAPGLFLEVLRTLRDGFFETRVGRWFSRTYYRGSRASGRD